MKLSMRSPLRSIVWRHMELGLTELAEYEWYLKGCDTDSAADERQLKRRLLAAIRVEEQRREREGERESVPDTTDWLAPKR